MLEEVAPDLFTATAPLRFVGLEVGCRMTVVRLSGGRLFVHSPIRHSQALEKAVVAEGTPSWFVAPNKFHHLFVGDWHTAFPGARLLLAPGLAAKRKDLSDAVEIDASACADFADEIEVVCFDGLPLVNEVVFFHRASATLIATDLAFHFDDDAPLLTRLMVRMSGRLGELAPTAVEKLLVRDRDAFRADLERVLEWPFDRVIVSHGKIVESGGRDALARGYDWLLTR